MTDDQQADLIKIAAVVTAVPRWAGALMAADGVAVPADWLSLWRYMAFFMSLAMAAVEGFAISFVFNRWRNQTDKRANLLLWLAIAMLVDFAVILTPYIVANVTEQSLAQVLGASWLLWLWSGAVAASTGLVVGSVGYAQRDKPARREGKARTSQKLPAKAGFTCDHCGLDWGSQAALNAHSPAKCAEKLASNGSEPIKETETTRT